MISNSEKTSVRNKRCKALPEAKKLVKRRIVKDSGFGYYYPNAVGMRSENMKRLVEKEGLREAL